MPIYAYKCSSCQHELDVLQKISDPPLTVCPQCGAPAFSKQLTAAGFQLKGSGWYATDFKNARAADAKPAANAEAAKPGDGASTPAKEPAAPKESGAGKQPAAANQPATASGAADGRSAAS